ncbi:MAG: hypothetical protein PHS80_03545 [Methanothrix sp.]|nr:hypothetical protein [Methanothrix sp.]MDD4448158.1 hypothetical protein [Methanothrix sp.]
MHFWSLRQPAPPLSGPPARAHARPPGSRESFSKENDEVEVGPKNGKVIVKPLIGAAEFKQELKGCMENLKIS